MGELLDAAIVGAGPAGLSAAVRLGRAGLRVRVLDEYPIPGGRLPGQVYRRRGKWFVGRAVAAGLSAEARALGVDIRTGRSVHGIAPDGDGWRLEVVGEGSVHARVCLVATGAAELPVPLPGWELPGVIGVGAAQVLASVWGVSPGRRGIIVGASPLAFAIAMELRLLGVDLRGIVLPPGHAGTRHLGTVASQWARLAALSDAAPGWARPAARRLADPAWQRRIVPRLPPGGVPVMGTRLRLSVMAERILGEREVRGIRLRRLGADGHPRGEPIDEEVDFVCLAGGLRPLPDLLSAAGADVVRFDGLGGEVPLVGRDFATTAPGLYAAGNAAGVEGAQVALRQGELAALGMLRRLRGAAAVPEPELRVAEAAVLRARAGAPFEFQPGVPGAWRQMAELWAERGEA